MRAEYGQLVDNDEKALEAYQKIVKTDGQSLTVEVTTAQGQIAVIANALAQQNSDANAQQRDITNLTVATQSNRAAAGFGTHEGGKSHKSKILESVLSKT